MDDDAETIVPESEYSNSSYTESPAVFKGLRKLFYLGSQETKAAVSPVIPMQGPVIKLVKSENGDSDNESVSLLAHSAPATQKTRNPVSSFSTPYKAASPQKNNQDGTGQGKFPASPDYSQTQPPERGYEVMTDKKWEKPSWESIIGLHKAPIDALAEVDTASVVSGSTHMSEPLIPLIDKGTGMFDDKKGLTDRISSKLPSKKQVPTSFDGYKDKFSMSSHYERNEETTNDTEISQPLIPLVSNLKQKKDVPLSRRQAGDIQIVSVPQSKRQQKQSSGKDKVTNAVGNISVGRRDQTTQKSKETIDMDALLQKHSKDMETMSSIERKQTWYISKRQEQPSETTRAQFRLETSQLAKTLNQIGRSNKEEKEEMTQIIKGGSASKYNKSHLKQRLTMLTARQKKLLQLMTIHKQIMSKVGPVQPKSEQDPLEVYVDNQQVSRNGDTEKKGLSDNMSKSLSSVISCSQISSLSTGSLVSHKSGGSLQDQKDILFERAGLSVTSAAALSEESQRQMIEVPTHVPSNLSGLDNRLSSTSRVVQNQVVIKVPASTQSSYTFAAKDAPLLIPVYVTKKQSQMGIGKRFQPTSTITKPSDLNLPASGGLHGLKPSATGQALPQSHIRIPSSPLLAGSLLGPRNKLLMNTSKMQLAQPGIKINQIGTPVSSVNIPPTTEVIHVVKPKSGFETSRQMVSNQADGNTTPEVTVLTAKPPTGRQVHSKAAPPLPKPGYKFPGFFPKRPLAPSMTSDDSSVVSRKRPRSYQVGLMNSSLKVIKEKKKNVKKTDKDSKLKQLVDQGIVQPGEDVLSIVTETNTFRASLKSDGQIQSSGGEIFHTPMSWCMAAVGTLQNRKMAYQKVIYNQRPLESYMDSLKILMSNNTEQTVQQDDVPLFKPVFQRKTPPAFDKKDQASIHSKQPAEDMKPRGAFDLLDLLQNCRIELIDNMELIPSTELPSDFWTTETLDKTLNWDFIDVW